jgi:ABC-2 type transport system permease protein
VVGETLECRRDEGESRQAVVTGAGGLGYHVRVVRVLSGSAFKLKYADSVLGYFWSLARPLGLFAILYVVFGRALRLGADFERYPLFLLLGVVLYFFFADATSRTMTSIVDNNQLLRRLAFPHLLIPLSTSVTALVTFGLNLVAIVVFVAWNVLVPRPDWLLLLPLVAELYAFALGTSLVLAALFARFRDIGTIWELVLRMFFYAAAIIYPIQLLPAWAERAILVIPFAQVMQDIRALILYDVDVVTVGDAFGTSAAYLVPLSVTLGLCVAGLTLFRRQESWVAERV